MHRIILNIHGIGEPGRTLEAGENVYWITPEFFATVIDLVKASGQNVAFTFDDGNMSDLEIGGPLLAEVGIQADFFVLAGRIGEAGSLGAAEIRELQTAGHRIGTHGWAHVDWTKQNEAGLKRELEEARSRLEDICGNPVTTAGIPFGRYNAAVLRALRKRGYTQTYSSDGGPVRGAPFPIPRLSLRADMSKAGLEAVLAGRDPMRKRIRRAITSRLKKVL